MRKKPKIIRIHSHLKRQGDSAITAVSAHPKDEHIRGVLSSRLKTVEDEIARRLEVTRAIIDIKGEERPDADLELQVVQVKGRLATMLREALDGIERQEYGRCRDCGAQIGEARLRAIPFAVRCTECQRQIEASEKVSQRGSSLWGEMRHRALRDNL